MSAEYIRSNLTLSVVLLALALLSAPSHAKKKLNNLDSDNTQHLSLNNHHLKINSPITIGVSYSKNLGVIFDARYSKLFTKRSAFSLGLEAGPRNYRISTTLGHEFNKRNRAKATIEQLQQKQEYNFHSGNTRQWLGQYGVGFRYEHTGAGKLFNESYLSANYVKADSKALNDKIYAGSGGIAFNNLRRIAGGTRKDISTGLKLGSNTYKQLQLDLHYDDIKYDTHLSKDTQQTRGLGATVAWSEQLTNKTRVKFLASNRRPYNAYQAKIRHSLHNMYGVNATLDLSLSHQDGKHGLFDDNRGTIQLTFGGQSAKLASRIHSLVPIKPTKDSLQNWTSQPAVYEPNILAISDELNELLSLEDIIYNENTVIDNYLTAAAFKNQGKQFSASGLPSGLSINNSTGVISGTTPEVNEDTLFPITVTSTINDGRRISLSFNLTVLDGFLSLPDVIYNENISIPNYLTAAAYKNRAQSYRVTGLPSGLSINSRTGTISGTTPEVTANTVFPVTVTGLLGDGRNIPLSFNLTVLNIVQSIAAATITTVCEGDPNTVIGTTYINSIPGITGSSSPCTISGMPQANSLEIIHNAGAATLDINGIGGVAITGGNIAGRASAGNHTITLNLAGTTYTINFNIVDNGANATLSNLTVTQ